MPGVAVSQLLDNIFSVYFIQFLFEDGLCDRFELHIRTSSAVGHMATFYSTDIIWNSQTAGLLSTFYASQEGQTDSCRSCLL